MLVLLGPFREAIKLCCREDSRYAVAGFHLRKNLIEITDTRMLIQIPCEQQDGEPDFPDVTFERPFALPPSTGGEKTGWFRKLRIRATKFAAHIANRDKTAVRVRVLDGQFPKTDEAWPSREPDFCVNLDPVRLSKLLAVFRACGFDCDKGDSGLQLRFRKSDNCAGSEAVEIFHPRSGIKALIMPLRTRYPEGD